MPVRVKQRAIDSYDGRAEDRQWELLRKNIAGLLLAWIVPVAVTMRDSKGSKKIVIRHNYKEQSDENTASAPLNSTTSVLSQLGYIKPDQFGAWVKISARTPFMAVRGMMSLEPVPTKQVQFISLGVCYLNHNSDGNILYEEINRLFLLSTFGNSDEVFDSDDTKREKTKDRRYKQDVYTKKQLKGNGKGVDRWPMFVIRIDHQGDTVRRDEGGQGILERENAISRITKVLGAITTRFLTNHHFRPRARHLRKHLPKVDRSSLKSERAALSQQGTLPIAPSNSPQANGSQGSDVVSETSNPLFERLGDSEKDTRVTKLSFARNQYIGEEFNSWSRIKYGRSRTTKGCLLYDECASKKIKTPRCQKESSSVERINSGVSNGDLGTENVGLNSTDDQIPQNPTAEGIAPQEDIDPVIRWTDPVSKEIVSVNARTGNLICRQTRRRSVAAHESDSQIASSNRPQHNCRPRLSGCTLTSRASPKAGSWVGELLEKWDNPVFQASEPAIPQISFDNPSNILQGYWSTDVEKAFTESASLSFPTKLSKRSLETARIIAQVDSKFILAIMHASLFEANSITHGSNEAEHEEFLVLIDQHAADERIRIEALFAELCATPTSPPASSPSPLTDKKSGIQTALLPKPLTFSVTSHEHSLFAMHVDYFTYWGIMYNLSPSPPSTSESTTSSSSATPAATTALATGVYKLTITALPPTIAERCRLEPNILLRLLRSEIWKRDDEGEEGSSFTSRPTASRSTSTPKLQPKKAEAEEAEEEEAAAAEVQVDWPSRISTCPRGIIDMLNSRACRSAIMFNDELSREECELLVRRLSG
ncbi:MAG: hypothetical protein Q9190_006492, partial [Brigantiaea leucoxantha]